jgi:hypothetical protein
MSQPTRFSGKSILNAIFVSCLLVISAFSGCSKASKIHILENEPTQFTAEWDDVRAAIYYTISLHEWAILSTDEPEPNVRVYKLTSFTDHPGTITFTAVPGEDRVSVDIQLGRFGNKAQESEFLHTLRLRFIWLQQRD